LGVTTVRPARPEDAQGCVDALASSPDFFTPETHDDARAGVAADRGWAADERGLIVGFVLARVRYPATAEITYAAVRPERRGGGIGTRLVRRALADLAADGVALVEVKTLDASAGYALYEATRAFWERRGFRQVDCIDPLPGWHPGNPAAIYVVGHQRDHRAAFLTGSQPRWTRTRPAVRSTLIT
jgi:ribosomal protein S18 acetylase RimI-like enzyme